MINLHFVKVRTLIWSLVLLVLLSASVWAINLIWFRPFNIDLFYERVVLEQALTDPEFLSQINWLDGYGLTFYKDDLTDESIASQRKNLQKARQDLKVLAAYNREEMSTEKQLSGEILKWVLTNNVKGERFLLHNYPLNPVNGVQKELPVFMVTAHELKTKKDAQRYIARLKKFDDKFEQVLAGLQLRQAKGMMPPRFVLESVLDDMRDFTATEPENNILFTHFCSQLGNIPSVDEEEANKLCSEVSYEIRCSVYPAYAKLIAFCQSSLTETSDAAGVWNLPNGDAFYAYSLSRYTTTNYTPQEVFTKGQADVDRILSEMDHILDSLGYNYKSVGQQMHRLAFDEKFNLSNIPHPEMQIQCELERALCEADTAFNDVFFQKPTTDVTVRLISGHGLNSPAHSYLPAMDGNEAALAINTETGHLPLYALRALAVAEGTPGKHSLLENYHETNDMPTFRKVIPFPAYTDGYALYAAQLAAEHNFFSNAYDNLGRLQMELYQTALMVADAGIHSQKWTRAQAVKYLAKTTGMPIPQVEQDVMRIISIPGQAAAEKAGMMKIMELRERAKVELGDEFDIREFHEILIKNGPMPLDVLEKQVQEYISLKQLSTASIFEV